MPSLGMLTINALAASDSVIIPVQAQYLPAKGMTQLVRTVHKVQRQINPNLRIDGVLLTLADMRTNPAKVTEQSIRQNYGKAVKIYQTIIPVSVKAAKAYEEFTREVSEEEYASVFNRYYRGKNAAFIKEGVGLGLYLAPQIAAAQGGYVKVASCHGEGSVFSLFLLKSPKGRKLMH